MTNEELLNRLNMIRNADDEIDALQEMEALFYDLHIDDTETSLHRTTSAVAMNWCYQLRLRLT